MGKIKGIFGPGLSMGHFKFSVLKTYILVTVNATQAGLYGGVSNHNYIYSTRAKPECYSCGYAQASALYYRQPCLECIKGREKGSDLFQVSHGF